MENNIIKAINSIEDIDLYMVKNCEGDKHLCNPKINESGLIECTECRNYFYTTLDKKKVRQIFNEQYGEFGKEKFRELMNIKKLVMKGKTQNLQPMLYGYEDDRMNSTSRLFYEQK